MPIETVQPKGPPIGTIVLLVLACGLYFAMLASISFSAGGGDAAFGDAVASFLAVVALWVVLAALLIAAAVVGQMPRWSAVAAFILVPFSGVAAFVAIDMCSRHIKPAVIVPAILPLLIVAYAMWARWPKLHALIPATAVSGVTWGLVFLVSLATDLAAL
jgi:hypothetical protein